jgi:type I restriction enzyme M protein
LLNSNKPENRKGKVQLIDANLMYRKLRKNLGAKNCEFSPTDIADITKAYLDYAPIERQLNANDDPIGIASKIFSNQDFGYYKVNIERPDRRKSRFTDEAIALLRFDKSLSEVMEHLYAEYKDKVYEKGFLKSISKDILKWCEENDFTLNTKNKNKLLDGEYWRKLLNILETAQTLKKEVGDQEFDDFNIFQSKVDAVIKTQKIKLSAPEKKAILNAVSWYDEKAAKVIKKVVKLSGDKLLTLLEHLDCTEEQLPDFGYYPTGKTGQFTTYEPNSDLRDAESIPLEDEIHRYFIEEVKPHVKEAWINLDSTKIGYEISFNKYFYRHKPLRSLKEVADDIIALEQKSEGLIAQILGVEVTEVQGE